MLPARASPGCGPIPAALLSFPPHAFLPKSSFPQVFPREYRRAMDEAAKLKVAQAAEAELLKEVRDCWTVCQRHCCGLSFGKAMAFEVRGAAPSTSTVGCNNNIEGAHYVLPPFPLQANGVDAFEELKKMAIDGEGAPG